MSGLVWSALGEGIGQIGTSMASYLAREADREDRQAERRREREEEARRQAERDALYRRTADQQTAAAAARGSGGGADGGLPARSIGEGGEDEAMLARRAGMTVPELRSLRKYSETGDTEPFKRDTNKITMKDTGDPYNPETESQIVKELPPGFEREARAKMQTLAKIEESYRLGGKYDDVTKGRRNQQEVDMSEAAIRQPEAAGLIGQGMAAGKGNDLVGGDSNVTRNKFTGQTRTTPVGESQITENRAQAAKYGAEADKAKREPTGKNEDLPTLQQMRMAAEKTLADARKALTEFDKVNTGDLSRPGREKLKEQRDALAAEVTTAREGLGKISDRLSRRLDETEAASKPGAAPKPAPAPSAGGELPRPKTPEEVAKLKPGTRFIAPDGSIRYR